MTDDQHCSANNSHRIRLHCAADRRDSADYAEGWREGTSWQAVCTLISMTLVFPNRRASSDSRRQWHISAADRGIQLLPCVCRLALCSQLRRASLISSDWAAIAAMGLTGLGMWGYAHHFGTQDGDSQWITMILFGFIALALSLADVRFYRAASVRGARRIARHLTNMMAGTIATVTAVLVVNVDTNPVWLGWILPTLLITPLTVWWNVRIARQGRKPSCARMTMTLTESGILEQNHENRTAHRHTPTQPD